MEPVKQSSTVSEYLLQHAQDLKHLCFLYRSGANREDVSLMPLVVMIAQTHCSGG